MATRVVEPEVDGLDFRKVLDLSLAAKNEVWSGGNDVREVPFRASSLGYCLRRQVFDAVGIKHTKVDGNRSLRTLAMGNEIHYFAQKTIYQAGLMIQEEMTLVDEELGISGHIDAIWGGAVQPVDEEITTTRKPEYVMYLESMREAIAKVYGDDLPVIGTEFKSSAAYAIEKMYQEGASPQHKLQLGTYELITRRNPKQLPVHVDQWTLTILSKDDMAIIDFPSVTNWADKAEERILELKSYLDEEKLPPCTCGQLLSWEPKYCAYRDPSSPDKAPICCDPYLFDQREEKS